MKYNKIYYFGAWRPSFGEMITRKIFEWVFNEPFPSQYPFFLGGQELDGYNAKLRIAFEHQSPFHDPNHKLGHRNAPIKDRFKQEMCNQNGVVLLQIPCIVSKKKSIESGLNFVIQKLSELEIDTRLDHCPSVNYFHDKKVFLQKLWDLINEYKILTKDKIEVFETANFIESSNSDFDCPAPMMNEVRFSTYFYKNEKDWSEKIKYWESRGFQVKYFDNLIKKAVMICYQDGTGAHIHIVSKKEDRKFRTVSVYDYWLQLNKIKCYIN